MSEIQKSTYESTVKYERHAESYAKNASIDLEDWQKAQYAELRKMKADPVYHSEYGDGPWSLSDQQLIYLTLQPEQQAAYENKYGHIDFGHALECYFKWCEYQSPNIEPVAGNNNDPIMEMLIA